MFEKQELASIVAALPGAVVGFDLDYRIDDGNLAALSLFGCTGVWLRGRSFVELIAPASRKIWDDFISASREADGTIACGITLEIIHASGSLRPVYCNVSAYEAQHGQKLIALLTERQTFDLDSAQYETSNVLSINELAGKASLSNSGHPSRSNNRPIASIDVANTLERLSYHIDNSLVGIVEFDADFKLIAWSNACEDLFGWRHDEVIGKTFNELGLLHPEDRNLIRGFVKGLDDPGYNSCAIVNRNVTKSGRIVTLEWFTSIFRDERGAALSALSIVVDRTAEVRAYRKLDDERQLFEAGPVIVTHWRDEAGYPIDYVSKNIETIVGYAPIEFVEGRTPTWHAIHPDDQRVRKEQVGKFLQSGADTQDMGPVRLLAANGDTIWITSFAMRLPTDDDGTARCMAYSVEITAAVKLQVEARKQQVNLQNVIDGTGAGTWELTLTTDELEVNERWAELLGYRLEELQPFISSRWSERVHPDDRPVVLAILDDHLAGRRDAFQAEYRLRHRDGHWVWVHDRGRIVEADESGKALVIAGTFVDISPRKEAELKVQAANTALQESNIELERFAYIASHDLQEPLRMVASFTQLLQKRYGDQLDDTAKEYIHFAVDGAKRMQQLIEGLLSYSRLGRQEIEEKTVDISALVGRVVQSMKISIEESNATVNCTGLPVVRGDAGQLYQLFQNLISNAIKYRTERNPLIEISFEYRDEASVFYVRDNGVGIEEGNRAKVFEVFRRLHSRADVPGTGIGLSVCQRVVERHGGRIWVESVLGEGSTFHFTIAADRYHRGEPTQAGAHTPTISADSDQQVAAAKAQAFPSVSDGNRRNGQAD